MGGAPRIAPGTAADVGRVNWLIARAIGLASRRTSSRRWDATAGCSGAGCASPAR
jgi:hypothetical protein